MNNQLLGALLICLSFYLFFTAKNIDTGNFTIITKVRWVGGGIIAFVGGLMLLFSK